jgi:hypothetical protein
MGEGKEAKPKNGRNMEEIWENVEDIGIWMSAVGDIWPFFLKFEGVILKCWPDHKPFLLLSMWPLFMNEI